MSKARCGIGYDLHRLAEGRPLIVGGITLPFDKGPAGHSDGDVLAHALCDALLGAAALGDIGMHFPDTDPKWRGANSRVFVRHVAQLLRERSYSILNVDTTVLADAPRLGKHRAEMCTNIAADLQIDVACVNVKATTSEGLGYIGRGEGLACQAIALLEISD